MLVRHIAVFLVLAAGHAFPITIVHAEERPNIVLYISDDLGRWDTSIHGSPDVETPTLDRLAAEGMTFEHAYVASPSCCPNRFSLLTGLMPARHGAHPNHSKPKDGTKFLPPLLKQAGYAIASFGKVAHGSRDFAGCDHLSKPAMGMSQPIAKWFAKTEADGPICLMVGDRRPHVTWTPENIYDPNKITLPHYLIDTPATREHWCRYMTDITGMDAEMGIIYEMAKKRFGDNFVFLFTSDHGGQWPFAKWNLYDIGIRVPLVAVWPGHIKAGVRSNAMVSWVDILPTLIDIGGADVPSTIDGRSFQSVLVGDAIDHRDRIYTTHTGDGPMNIFPIRSVRTKGTKYIWNLLPDAYHTNHSNFLRRDGAGFFWHSWERKAKTDAEAQATIDAYYLRPPVEVFDVEADPQERTNLANNPAYAEVAQQLRADLEDWVASQGDDLQPHQAPYPNDQPLPPNPQPKKAGKRKPKSL